MISATFLSESQQRSIAEACQLHDVKRLDLFGSRVRQDSMSSSDFDFLVEFNEPLRPGILDRYLALQVMLQSIVAMPVDLVEVSSVVNPYLRRRIEEDRQLIYAA
jgi:uncharacterized protein